MRGIEIVLALLAVVQGIVFMPAIVECPKAVAAIMAGCTVYAIMTAIFAYEDWRSRKDS